MSIYRNLDDVAAQLRAAGLLLETVKKTQGGTPVGDVYVESARSVRCDVAGEKKKHTGAYRLHELRLNDGIWITGAYWTGHGNAYNTIELNKECEECGADMALKEKTCPACGSKKSKKREFSPEQIEAHKKRMAELRRQAEAEAKAEADRAAGWANAVWLKCREANEPTGPGDYIARKKLKSGYGTRIFDGNDGIMLDGAEKDDYEYLARFTGARVIPMCDEMGRRRRLQFILDREKHKDWIARREGDDKMFWPSGPGLDGLFFQIGGSMHKVGLITEGIATGGSLFDETNIPVAVAFNAGNMPKVGERIWKSKKKRVNLLYCADDDWVQRCDQKNGGCGKYTPVNTPTCKHCGNPHGKGNAGVEKASAAALATSGAWLAPQFSTPRPDDRKGPTDFNDLRCIEGPGPVRAQVEAKLSALGWGNPSSAQSAPRAGPSPEGERGKARNDAVSVMELDDAVERFVPLDDGSGDALFDTWTNKIVKVKQMVALLAAGARWDDVKRHPVWIARGAYYIDQVGFDPAGNDKTVKLNTWRGWPMEPKEGSCELLLELLQYLCSLEKNSEEIYRWLLCWMAYPLQHPGAKMSSAVIMHGPQGTGKSTVFQTLSKIYADYATVLNQRGLEDKFNADWVDTKLFLLAEEVVTRAEMWHIKNELKELVTGDWVRVNGKFAGAYRQRNHINIAYLSNEGHPLPVENDDRRHCVVWTPPELGPEYYEQVQVELENGGVEAFYHYLMTLDLTGFHPKRRPPDTQAKRNLIDLSRPSEERFLLEWIAGDITFSDDVGALPFCPAGTTDLYAAYMKWCRQQGEFRPRALNQFIGYLSRRNGWSGQHRDRWNHSEGGSKKLRQRMIEPSDTDINAHLKANGSDHRQKPDETVVQWATRCFFGFRQALGGDQ